MDLLLSDLCHGVRPLAITDSVASAALALAGRAAADDYYADYSCVSNSMRRSLVRFRPSRMEGFSCVG